LLTGEAPAMDAILYNTKYTSMPKSLETQTLTQIGKPVITGFVKAGLSSTSKHPPSEH
jgi:hypothetical protein